jgi:hypothetical protein
MTDENNSRQDKETLTTDDLRPSSKDIWNYLKLPILSLNVGPKEMFRSNKLRFGNSKITGASAETKVIAQINDNIGWAVTKEETQASIIDLFAISVQPPYKIACIQVKSASRRSPTIHVDAKHLEFDTGPIWVIAVETKPKHHEYLIFSFGEFKKFVAENARHYSKERGYSTPEYDFSVPKNLEQTPFAKFIGQWKKIETNARPYMK